MGGTHPELVAQRGKHRFGLIIVRFDMMAFVVEFADEASYIADAFLLRVDDSLVAGVIPIFDRVVGERGDGIGERRPGLSVRSACFACFAWLVWLVVVDAGCRVRSLFDSRFRWCRLVGDDARARRRRWALFHASCRWMMVARIWSMATCGMPWWISSTE